MSKLVEKRNELDAKRKSLANIFEEAGSELDLSKVKSISGDTAYKAGEIKRLNDELTALGKEVDSLADMESIAASVKAGGEVSREMHHTGDGAQAPAVKSLGELFVGSPAFKQFSGRRGPSANVQVDVKTLMTTAAGWAPQSIRSGRVVMDEQREPTLLDLIPINPINQAANVYMEETTFTNNAAERTEGGNNAGEAALVLTQQTSLVREIPVWIPVTKEQLADVSYAQSYVNNRLGLMVRQRLEGQCVAGDGNAPNLLGILANGSIQTQALGADPVPDAVYKAMVLVETNGMATPNAAVFHPLDWQDVRLLRTLDGLYIWGNPSEPGPDRIWGLPVIKTTACTQNTAIVGDFRNYCDISMREDVTFEVTDSHGTLFIQRTMAILAYLRAAFTLYRPTAFCQVTGI